MTVAAEPAVPSRAVHRRSQQMSLWARLMSYLPRGNLLDDDAWQRRHLLVRWILMIHIPGLTVFGLWRGLAPTDVLLTMLPTVGCLALGTVLKYRRPASFFTTGGIVYCSSVLVGFSGGTIEAHFHFFVIIGFIALYQDWVPFLLNIVFTVLSHGVGSTFRTDLMFNHHSAYHNPWLWSLIHGIAVLAACIGMVLFWRTLEDEQQKSLTLTKELAEAEVGRFTSELLVNLARRNQSMLYRQLEIINQLEEQEQDPDALADLFRLDHLATRIRRNAESLLVLSGEEPARVWSSPVRLVDVVRAAIAETEDLGRVNYVVDERLAIMGHAITDLTHLIAELAENAVRFSPPGSRVTVRSTPDVRSPGAWVLTVEDWGVGMPAEELAVANDVLVKPRDFDVAVSQRLGLHVVSRLAHRHEVNVSLTSTGVGVTAVIQLPPQLFAQVPRHAADVMAGAPGWTPPPRREARLAALPSRPGAAASQVDRLDSPTSWGGWWSGQHGGPPVPAQVVMPDVVVPNGNGSRDDAPRMIDLDATLEATVEATVTSVGDAVGEGPALDARAGDAAHEAETADGMTSDPAADEPAENGGVRFNRRKPQANLAPELRRGRGGGPAGEASGPVSQPDAVRARDALSRYQANRQSALSKSDEDEGETR